jgi:hypothetical protein
MANNPQPLHRDGTGAAHAGPDRLIGPGIDAALRRMAHVALDAALDWALKNLEPALAQSVGTMGGTLQVTGSVVSQGVGAVAPLMGQAAVPVQPSPPPASRDFYFLRDNSPRQVGPGMLPGNPTLQGAPAIRTRPG